MQIQQISMFDLEPALEKENLLTVLAKSDFPYGRTRERAEALYAENKDPVEMAKFLRDEKGIGGHSITYDGKQGFVDYNAKGASVKFYADDMTTVERFTYAQLAKEIIRLINCGHLR